MREKLNSQRGASLLIALLYFLVCGLVAAVIIGAAMTNVQKLKGAHQRQQAYNSVSSAAQLIRDEMTRVQYQGVERWKAYECNRVSAEITIKEPGRHSDEYDYESFQATSEEDKSLTKLILPGVEKVYHSYAKFQENRESFNGWQSSFTVDDGVCPVEVNVKLNRDYTLTFTLAPQQADLAEDYRMTLVSKGQAGEPVESSTNENCYHEKVTYWESLANKYVTEGRNFPVEVHHYTTTIQWTRGTISKGVSRDES